MIVQRNGRPHRPLSPLMWYSVGAIVVSCIIVTVLGTLYTQRVENNVNSRTDQVVRDSNQRWCTIISTLDDAYSANPPPTPTGQVVAREMAKLRSEFGCPPTERKPR